MLYASVDFAYAEETLDVLYNRILASIQLSHTGICHHVYLDCLADLEGGL